jgi:coenzyme PQQ biosynthesis protein PqqD
MIAEEAKPRLASKARIRLDKQTGQQVLLYPEKGLVLNPTGARILALCTGERTFVEIVSALRVDYTQGPAERLEADVEAFLRSLEQRGLIEGLSA